MKPKDPKWCPYPYRGHSHRYWEWYGPRPPRHWFFMRIFGAFIWICMALVFIPFFSEGHFSLQGIPRHLFWTLLVMCAGFLLLRRIFRPLRMLMKGVKELSEGNLDFQFDARGRHGEIQYLAESFNHMTRSVKEMVQSKEQLLLDVSHELRSPLTRMKVALEMAPKGKHRDSMLRDVAEMETMVTEILETERLKNGNGRLALGPVNLVSLVRETLAKTKNRKPHVKLLERQPAMVVQADEARIRTVLQNVVENALKYSAHQKKPVQISLEKREEGSTVLIQDFGQGIHPDEQEKVFEPFYRVDKSRTKGTGGYGLGLSLCRVIMRAHGGEITLESSPGKGVRAFLFFPPEDSSPRL